MRSRHRRLGAHVVLSGVLLSLSTIAFQNCGDGFETADGGHASASAARLLATRAALPGIVDRYAFSAGFQGPASKQGASEARIVMDAATADARYNTLQSWGAGYRQYNMYWSELETSGQASSASPLSCAPGTQLVPANESQRASLGYHRFRCISSARLALWDDLFKRDATRGMQSGVVLYSAPALYRHPECVGFPFGGNYLKDGCVPRDDAMDDFEDFINLAASRYNGSGSGKISHFIVWNENASADWFDDSPYVAKTDASAGAYERRIDKLADMMKRVHAALARHQKNALMYVSTDQLWNANLATAHMGTRWLLDGLWVRLGTDYSWSVAVHPYGEVDQPAPAGVYTFNNLEMVSQHQAQRLAERGVGDPSGYPQYRLIASEQGWPIDTAMGAAGAMGREKQARQICLAHAKVTAMPNLVASGHNYFHSVEPLENSPGGTSGQGAFFGLIPQTVGDSLGGAASTPTGRAFMSTMNMSRWNQANDHYCCQLYGLGCAGSSDSLSGVPSVEETHPIMGIIDGIESSSGAPVLRGWACARSMDQSIAVHLYVGGSAGVGRIVTGVAANAGSEPAVAGQCVSGSMNYRFAIPLDNNVRVNYSGQRIYVHGISPIGLSNSLLTRSGEFVVPGPDIVAADPGRPNLASYPMVVIYRFYAHSDHLLTTNVAEGQGAGYSFDGAVFQLVRGDVSDSRLRTVYRCFAGNHFMSFDPGCEGQSAEGAMGQVVREPAAGTRALYRFWNPISGDHLITVVPSEVSGWVQEQILGYVF